jgi:hypothetical protein
MPMGRPPSNRSGSREPARADSSTGGEKRAENGCERLHAAYLIRLTEFVERQGGGDLRDGQLGERRSAQDGHLAAALATKRGV